MKVFVVMPSSQVSMTSIQSVFAQAITHKQQSATQYRA